MEEEGKFNGEHRNRMKWRAGNVANILMKRNYQRNGVI